MIKKLINNDSIIKNRVVLYEAPKIHTQKEIENLTVKGLTKKKKIKLNHVKI